MDSMVGHENIKIVFIEALKVKLKKKKLVMKFALSLKRVPFAP